MTWCQISTRPHFYQTRPSWSMDQGSTENNSPVNNFAPTVNKFCVMWEGQALPHDTNFFNCRGRTVDSRAFPSWSLIHRSRWSGLIKVVPGHQLQPCLFDLQWSSIARQLLASLLIQHQLGGQLWLAQLLLFSWHADQQLVLEIRGMAAMVTGMS